MSWFDSIIDGVGSLFSGKSVLGGVVSSVITGYALNKVNQSINKTSKTTSTTRTVTATDFGQLITLPSNQDNNIPVLYGTAYVSGSITDAIMSADRQTMTYVVTLCECTGNLINGSASAITFDEVLWNGNKINFDSDGVTALSTTDSNGNVDKNIEGLVKVYKYPKGSTSNSPAAISIVPNWTAYHSMDNLAFCVITVKYNNSKGVVGLPNLLVKMTNSMNQPGDCIYDFMTNTRYGCGIKPEDINQ